MGIRIATVNVSEILARPDCRLDAGFWVAKAEEEDFPGIPAEDADEYEREVLLDETDGLDDEEEER